VRSMEQTEVRLVAEKDEYVAFILFCFVGIMVVTCLFIWGHLIWGAATAGLLLLVSGVIYGIRKVTQNHPEYIIANQGIHFGPSLGNYWIPWADINGISDQRQINGPAYVQLRLKTDSAYWLTLSPLRKQLLRIHMCGRKVCPSARVHTAGLPNSHQQVLVILQDYFQKYQKNELA